MAYSMTVRLSPAQLEERRRQLDRAGWHAWISPIVILLVIYIFRRVLSASVSKAPGRAAPRAPLRNQKKDGWQLFLRCASWILQSTYISEFGPLYIQILGLFYAAWLFYLTSRATGDDYMHITKAFGHVAISQLPFHYLLSLKSARLSPVYWATGLTHERLNAVHRLFGRIVHLWLGVHAVLYLRFFIVMGFLEKRIKDRDVRLGGLAFWSFNFLGLLALPIVRRRMYHVLFYRSHVVLSAMVIPVLWFHVPYTRWLVAQVAAIYVAGAVARFSAAKNVQALSCRMVEGTELVKVKFGVERDTALANWVPGQHVYVVGMRKGGLRTKTPFTIAHAEGKNEEKGKSIVEIDLVLRDMGGPGTAGLSALCSDPTAAYSIRKEVIDQMRIEGPYGEASEYMPSFLDPSSHSKGFILLVAGGIGVTYTLPIYLSLLSSHKNRGRKIKFIWLVKSLAEVRWVTELLLVAAGDGKPDSLDVELFITRPTPAQSSTRIEQSASLGFMKTKGLRIHTFGHLPRLKQSIDEAFVGSTSVGVSDVDVHAARDLASEEGDVSVFVCGPSSLSRDVRRIVGRWVWRDGKKVRWFEEVFGFGGS